MGIKIYWYTPIPNSPLGIKNAPTHMAINTKALMAQNLKHLKTTFTLLSAYICQLLFYIIMACLVYWTQNGND